MGPVGQQGPTLNTARNAAPAFGTQTAAVMAGGSADPGRVANAEEFNGNLLDRSYSHAYCES